MRPFRDFLTAFKGVTLATIAVLLSGCQTPTSQPPVAPKSETVIPADSDRQSYYPLSVGNSWTFRCSAEGESQFEKTLTLTAVTPANNTRFFRAELRRSGDKTPVVYYLFQGGDGTIYKTHAATTDNAEPLARAALRPGDRVGSLGATAPEVTSVPALQNAEIIRLETFSLDDPNVPQDKRAEWLGRSYAKGIGPVIEADGLGGECVLTVYHLAGR